MAEETKTQEASEPRRPPELASPKDLQLEPKLEVRRLNRVALLSLATLLMLVLWTAYFVLTGRSSLSDSLEQRAQAPAQTNPASIDRLLREAQDQALWMPPPEEPLFQPRIGAPVPSSPAAAPIDSKARRRKKAMEAALLVPAFGQGKLESPKEEALPDLGFPAWARPGGLIGQETSKERSEPRSMQFLNEVRQRPPSVARLASLQAPAPFTLMEGTLIPATLTAGIHSDLPGQTRALVRRNVYDSVTGRHLLIPQGSRLLGRYDHQIAWGQKRVLLAWHRLVLPDGRSLDLQGIPGVDLAAQAGLKDRTKSHLSRAFGSRRRAPLPGQPARRSLGGTLSPGAWG